MTEPTTGALLRAAAAGRREYAVGAPPRIAADLTAEADTLETAARIADGDLTPLYGLLPSWRWTAAMDRLVLNDAGDSISIADVAGLGGQP